MSSHSEDQLAQLGRYEALYELTNEINASTTIDEASSVLARRLKFVADVFAWRYLSLEEEVPQPGGRAAGAILIDGFRGRAEIEEGGSGSLSSFETELWKEHRARMLCNGSDAPELEHLPDHFRRPDVAQIYSHPLTTPGERRALFLFCKRREPFNDLDMKFVALVSGFFHRRVQMLWEQRKLRELEVAYLRQEVTLRQSEKLATLGRLSAGMAHELNNPVSAALRCLDHLREEVERLERARFELGSLGVTEEQVAAVEELEVAAEKGPTGRGALERADLEERLESWLEGLGVDEPWELAAALAAMGQTPQTLDRLRERFESEAFLAAIAALSCHDATDRLLAEMEQGMTRISEIVGALKSYSYMDQAPIQQVDVRQGLEDTLLMLDSRLGEGIAVIRDYAEDLPSIEAYGSELNQVWTNLIDNALAAMADGGELTLKARPLEGGVVVEVTDTGPGIPRQDQGKVFDPFFTTKAPGEGTGLGLSVSHNIVVQKHGGEIEVSSRPGHTTFSVRLPLEPRSRESGSVEEPPEPGSPAVEAARSEDGQQREVNP